MEIVGRIERRVIDLTAYVHLDSSTLATMKTEAEAERTRVLVAGQSFMQPGGRQSTRIDFSKLMAHIAAINFAIKYNAGTIVDKSYADLSGGPL